MQCSVFGIIKNIRLNCFHFSHAFISTPLAFNMGATDTNVSTATTTGKPASSYKELLVEQRQNLLLIKFNKPASKNALNRQTYYELIRALNEGANNATITIIALTGVGDTFSAGNDLTQTRHYADVREFFKSSNYVMRSLVKAFVTSPKVLVAVVNGPCIGIGFTLSALCDVVYCTESAYFQGPFTKLGICPEAGSTYLLPLILGRSKAGESLLFGERLTAQEALQFQFVARVFKNEDLDTVVWPKIVEYSMLPAESLIISKKLLIKPLRENVILALEAECVKLEKLRYGDVYMNSIEAFKQKRSNKSKL